MSGPLDAGRAPHVSVIVPHYNQPAALKLCLQSLTAQKYPPHAFEVIVVDNASDDEAALAEALRAHPGAILAVEPQRGAAHARNAAIARARGRVFAFIDADCVADPCWIAAGLEGLEGADLAGGDVRVTVAEEGRPSPVESFEKVFAFRQEDYISRKRFSVTANLFATRDVVEETGPFVHGVSEDVEWCRRAVALGFRLAFNARSIISHPARRDWSELIRKWERLVTERWNGFGGRSLPSRMAWAGLAVATALSAAPHLLTVLTTGRLTRLEDRIAAAGVLVRIRFWRAGRMLAAIA
jgi:glycosyltransferase involved in cell wall biosynthesis